MGSHEAVIFQGCRIGRSYKEKVEIQNLSRMALDLRILPCTNRAFSNDPLKFDSATRKRLGAASGAIPPATSCFLTVHFTPKTLDDQSDQLVIATEFGNVSL